MIIMESAFKHGLSAADIVHAYENVLGSFPKDPVEMLVGRARDGRLLELGVILEEPERSSTPTMHAPRSLPESSGDEHDYKAQDHRQTGPA